MLSSLSTKTGRNRSEVAGILIKRHQMLMATADLSGVSLEDFQTLCLLKSGIDTDQTLDAKFDFSYAIDYRLKELAAFTRETAGIIFKDDGPKSRTGMATTLEGDRSALHAVHKTIDGLDNVQCLALLEKIEEVYARAVESPAADLYEISRNVYEQGIRHHNG